MVVGQVEVRPEGGTDPLVALGGAAQGVGAVADEVPMGDGAVDLVEAVRGLAGR